MEEIELNDKEQKKELQNTKESIKIFNEKKLLKKKKSLI